MAQNKAWIDPPIAEPVPAPRVAGDIVQVPGITQAAQPWGLIPSVERGLNRKSDFPLMMPGENARKGRGRG